MTKGATTIWEHWDGINEDNVPKESLNHYSYGAVAGWFFQYVAGIDMDDESNGYKSFIIAPKPGGTLTKARGIYNSMYGRIESSWEKTNEMFNLEIQIPPNTSAKVIFPCSDLKKAKVKKW